MHRPLYAIGMALPIRQAACRRWHALWYVRPSEPHTSLDGDTPGWQVVAHMTQCGIRFWSCRQNLPPGQFTFSHESVADSETERKKYTHNRWWVFRWRRGPEVVGKPEGDRLFKAPNYWNLLYKYILPSPRFQSIIRWWFRDITSSIRTINYYTTKYNRYSLKTKKFTVNENGKSCSSTTVLKWGNKWENYRLSKLRYTFNTAWALIVFVIRARALNKL